MFFKSCPCPKSYQRGTPGRSKKWLSIRAKNKGSVPCSTSSQRFEFTVLCGVTIELHSEPCIIKQFQHRVNATQWTSHTWTGVPTTHLGYITILWKHCGSMAHCRSKSSELRESTGTYHLWALMWVFTLESMHPLEDAANVWYLTFFTFPYEALTGLLSTSPSWPFVSNSWLVFTKRTPCPSGSILGLSPFGPLLCPWHVLASPYLPTASTTCPSCQLFKPSLRLSRPHSWITRRSPCSDICSGHKFPGHNLRCLRMELSSHSVIKCDF